MDPRWLGIWLSLSLIGVVFVVIFRLVVATLPLNTRRMLRLYLLFIGTFALIGFCAVLPVFEYFAFYGGSQLQIIGTVLVGCFILVCVGLTALFDDDPRP